MRYTFIAEASVTVAIDAATEDAARAAYEDLNLQDFALGFTTIDGHHLETLTLTDSDPMLD